MAAEDIECDAFALQAVLISVCPFPELGRGDAFFFLEEGGELPGILEFQAVGYFRDVQVAAGQQFLGFQQFLL